ncbi:ankyrin repeat domain-containing protein [Granulosicoccus sp.]|nr:ankyrin repeat domain-containing protein [Granulosicoccus sp.]MDB4224026.1 ankyrin repeat domain-containing protein [Granulosicoccus sp.]
MKSIVLKNLKFVFVIKFILSTMLLQSSLVQASDTELLDRALIKSLAKKDYKAAEKLLKKGANPEAIFGSQLSDNAVCTAIDDRSSTYLELLIEYGASANALFDVQHELRRTPLVCSVYLQNYEAFDYLLENGADPSVDLNPESIEKYRNSSTAFTTALNSGNYPLALRLLKLYSLHSAELQKLIFELENSHYDESHPWNPARDELIAWTLERVPTLNAIPASPANGTEPDCLFSFRDLEEGLKKGTICRETEEIK